MDAARPRGDNVRSPRNPYQPTVVCGARYCRRHFDYGAMVALQTARNDVDLMEDGMTHAPSTELTRNDMAIRHCIAPFSPSLHSAWVHVQTIHMTRAHVGVSFSLR